MEGTVILGAKLVFVGFCLTVGYWTAKKVTDVADEYLEAWNIVQTRRS